MSTEDDRTLPLWSDPRPECPSFSLRDKYNSLNTLHVRGQELCENRGGRPGLPVRNSADDLCGRKATLNLNTPSLAFQHLPTN